MMAKGDHVIELWEASIFFKTRNQIARTVLPRHCQWLVPWVPTYQLSRASSRRARLSPPRDTKWLQKLSLKMIPCGESDTEYIVERQVWFEHKGLASYRVEHIIFIS